MYSKIKDIIRKVVQRLGIIKDIESIGSLDNVSMSEDMHNEIDKWKHIYRGHLPEWHNITYKTIEGDKQRKLDTLNMGKNISAEMSSLVYNEKCEISIGDDDNETSEFINDVFRHNKFNRKFQDSLEYSFAMGGMVAKPYVSNDKIKISFVTADCFIPVAWDNDNIFEGVFVNEFYKGERRYTHLEWHVFIDGVYTIKNEVYESQNGNTLGNKVPLDKFFPDIEEEVGIPSLNKPLFVYFKPNTANNIDLQSPLGISLFSNALDSMHAVDVMVDSLHREFRLGKKRIIVPAHMVKTVIDEGGHPVRYFDSSDETYEAFDGDMDENKIHDVSVELRVEEHISAINAMLNLVAMQTGFSSGSFTFDGESMKTATEVVSEQSKTFKSKKSHEIIIEAGIIELIDSILMLSQLYGLHTPKEEYEVSVEVGS